MKRFYLALTNHCNRECEVCCTFSDPSKKTFLSFEWIENFLSNVDTEYEAQLEGGEPMIHPDYHRIIDYLNNDERCIKIILTTNSTLFPYAYDDNHKIDKGKSLTSLVEYFRLIEKPFVLKPSVNNYLIERDPNLFDKIEVLNDAITRIDGLQWGPNEQKYSIFLNIRKRTEGDQWIIDELEKRNLTSISNVYFFQKYGKAADSDYELPFIIDNPVDFYLISPDGKIFPNTPDCLLLRSEHMKLLP